MNRLLGIVIGINCIYFDSVGAEPLRIAALLSKKTSADYICITQGVVAESNLKDGSNIQVDAFEYNDTLTLAIQKAKNIAKGNYFAVIGPRTSQEALATAPIFQEAKIPQVLPVASHVDLTSDFNHTVAMVSSSSHYSDLVTKWIVDSINPRKIFIVANLSQPYSTYYRNQLPLNLKNFKIRPNVINYDIIDGAFNQKDLLTRLRKEKPDLVYAPIYTVDAANVYKVVVDSKIASTMFTHAGLFEVKEILEKNYSQRVRLYFNGIWDLRTRGKHGDEFVKVIRKYCPSSSSNVRVATGFDAINLILDVHHEFPKARLLDFVKKTDLTRFQGILGERVLDQFRIPKFPLQLFELKNTGFTFVSTIN